MNKIDIRTMPEIIDALNAVLNNRGIAEIKNESRSDVPNIVIVEITRTLKTEKRKK